MAANDYTFVTGWRVEGTPQLVFDILDDPAGYPRWWPSVWLEAELVNDGRDGSPRTIRFLSRGRLPYTLRWTARRVAADPPSRIVVQASGDFEGTGEWTIAADGPSRVAVQYVWTITANKPLLRYLSPVMRPLFEWNHRWAMTQGEESLRRELARRVAHGS
ncbi:MAG TPA: SRPBCC family protein [Vicinamibacterales bacterium]|nr:SRPBCC family protein [Vicinamibacterales bacterium]